MKLNVLKKWITKSGHKATLTLFQGHINGYVIPNLIELKNNAIDYYTWSYTIEEIPSAKLIDLQKQINDIKVHGGLTYYGTDLLGDYAFGFDTAHNEDAENYIFALANTTDEKEIEYILAAKEIDDGLRTQKTAIWRDMDYCTKQCESLSLQLKVIEDKVSK